MIRDYDGPSRKITRTRRWRVLRRVALQRDGWACVKCGSRSRLEVDHIIPVRDREDLSYDLTNLQTLCCACHGAKTRVEVGLPQLSPQRLAWRKLLKRNTNNA